MTVLSLYALDFFVRIGALCLAFNWRIKIGILNIAFVFLLEVGLFFKDHSILFCISLLFSHNSARSLGRRGQLEFILRLFLSLLVSISSYFFGTSVSFYWLLFYIGAAFLALNVYVFGISD